MKKFGALLLVGVLALSFALTGCGAGGKSAGNGKIKVGVVNNPLQSPDIVKQTLRTWKQFSQLTTDMI